jgi:hypothetical protein
MRVLSRACLKLLSSSGCAAVHKQALDAFFHLTWCVVALHPPSKDLGANLKLTALPIMHECRPLIAGTYVDSCTSCSCWTEQLQPIRLTQHQGTRGADLL